MKFTKFLQENIVLLDGGMGTLLQSRGLGVGELPERWNITHANEIVSVHKAYFDAGSNVVCTNTFGANGLKFADGELEVIVKSAFENAKKAKEQSTGAQEKYIALDVGPLGRLLKPYGDLHFEDAVALFAKTVKLGEKYGADLILIETMNDAYETKAAILAAKENSSLPIVVSCAYGEDKKLTTGASPSAIVALAEGLGVTAVGANCSLGPNELEGVVKELIENASIPVVVKPNAGLPKLVDGKAVFDITKEEFAKKMQEFVKGGARIVGGCCGTTPEYIAALKNAIDGLCPVPITDKQKTVISSYTHAVEFGEKPLLIGERINPTGKKRFQQALREKDVDYLLNEGVRQQEKGVHILDVNVGLPDVDEKELLTKAVCELQAVISLPLQIDTSSVCALESALRRYNGKALINSVNGKKESMEKVFPLVKKYGGVVVALTLDEGGIPENAAGRVEIAQKILKTARKYKIAKKDVIFDPLTLTVSADSNAANVTLCALKEIRQKLKAHTVLGVSNVSFGLPNRDAVNSAFFTLAMQSGLSAAIMNPFSVDMMKSFYAFNALKGLDENCVEYVKNAPSFTVQNAVVTTITAQEKENYSSPLQRAVVKGFKESAGEIAKELLKSVPPLELVNQEIIPALDIVGEGFEKKTVFLPQLLMSAEAAKSAFEEVKKALLSSGEQGEKKGPFVLATVEGDIHDIGKNIVKLLLENYAFDVVDLGKDVKAETIAQKTVELQAKMVGLSALMTTTVPNMEKTIRLLKERAPWCKIIVGGAVLTAEYAQKIGADYYAKDGMETVRIAEKVLK